jgi:uncharacterized protein (TIGR03437 family)
VLVFALVAPSVSVAGGPKVPTIKALEPTVGVVGENTPVMITGSNLSFAHKPCTQPEPKPCKVSVAFGEHPALMVYDSSSEVIVLAPAVETAQTENVTVTVNGVKSNSVPFVVE